MMHPNKKALSGIVKNVCASAMVLSLVACGGSADVPLQNLDQVGQAIPESDIGLSNQIVDDPTSALPVKEVTAATGVEIVFADEAQQSRIGSAYIEEQWIAMQTCLKITAMTPKVIVVSDGLSPLGDSDDVLRYIDGSITATATVDDSSATIQIIEADLDGSLGDKGDYLRSILGRYLWFSADLPERGYRYDCANQTG